MVPLTGIVRGTGSPRAHGLALASAFSFVLLAALVWNTLSARQAARRAVAELEARERVQAELVRLDTALQSAALSASVSQQAEGWSAAHARASAELRGLFESWHDVDVPDNLRSALRAAEFARDIKTAIERRALSSLAAGDPVTASIELHRAEYHEQTHQFSHSMEHFEAAQLEDAVARTHLADDRLRRSLLWTTVLFALLTAVWIFLLRASRQRERAREEELQQRRRTQRALAESLAMYRALFETSNDIVLLVDSRSSRIVDTNERASATLGYSRQEFATLRLSTICDGDLSAHDGCDTGCAVRLRHRNGQAVPVVVRRQSVRINDRDYEHIAARDMSTCRSLEAQLQRAQRLESVGQLACGIAHEFSNLALALAGQAHLMRHAMARGQDLDDSLDRIEAVAAEARRISRSLMSFSGHAHPDRHAVDVRRIATQTVDLLVHVLPPGIRLETDGLSGDPLCVLGDEGEIEQILLNLALNARDAMPSGGTLWLSCAAEGGHTVRIVVGDTGTGIPHEDLDRIFDPLFTTKPPGSGTGLGLSIVDQIVRRLDGDIAVSTRPGEGSSFTVTLPRLVDARRDGAGTTAFGDEPGRPLSVRLVVANAAARSLLRTELEARGHRVTDAGPSAGDSSEVDLAIVTGALPGPVAGLHAARVLRIADSGSPDEAHAGEDDVVVLGPAVALDELVRVAENIARLRTGGRP